LEAEGGGLEVGQGSLVVPLFIPPPKPSAPTPVGAHVENAENAQVGVASPPIDDKYDAFDDDTDPKDDDKHGATDSACSSDDTHDDFDDADRNFDFDNDIDHDMHEPGD
jgi:hypothetical protein